MRKAFILSVFFFFSLLVGCESETGDLKPFDNSELKEQMKEEAFQSKLPTKLPFKVNKASLDSGPPGQEVSVITIDFFGERDGTMRDSLGLMVSRKGNQTELTKSEKYIDVEIGEKKGKYNGTDSSKQLEWIDGGILYKMIYFTEVSKTKVSKDALIEVAKSFK